MTTRAPTLLELQRAVGRDMLGLTDGDASAYIVPDGIAAPARLAIYRHTADSALVAALRLTYPAVHALVGDACFEGVARRYIAQCRPSSALLDRYGETFADWLAALPETAALAYLPDTARLEWAVNEVLHAPDTTPLDVQQLAQWNEATLACARFAPSPTVRLLRCDFPVDAIWRAVLTHDDRALAEIDVDDGPVWLDVCRGASGLQVTRIAEWQWTFAATLRAGRPLRDALAGTPNDDAYAWFACLLASGCFIGASVTALRGDSPIEERAT